MFQWMIAAPKLKSLVLAPAITLMNVVIWLGGEEGKKGWSVEEREEEKEWFISLTPKKD